MLYWLNNYVSTLYLFQCYALITITYSLCINYTKVNFGIDYKILEFLIKKIRFLGLCVFSKLFLIKRNGGSILFVAFKKKLVIAITTNLESGRQKNYPKKIIIIKWTWTGIKRRRTMVNVDRNGMNQWKKKIIIVTHMFIFWLTERVTKI
jgi:hypothetical protein